MKLKTLLFLSLISLFTLNVFAQETETQESEQSRKGLYGKIYSEPTSFKDFIHSTDIIAELGPALYLNTESDLVSAPSPIVYPITLGFLWPNYTFIAMQPTLSFFHMYHLYYDGMALPAEIENRTTDTLSFMLNLPVVFSLYYAKNRLQINGGIGMLMRFGMKAYGVADDDYGYLGTAGEDVTAINKWFWSNARYLYITTGAAWLLNLTGNLKAGPSVNIYFPIGTLFNRENVQGLIITVGMKVSL